MKVDLYHLTWVIFQRGELEQFGVVGKSIERFLGDELCLERRTRLEVVADAVRGEAFDVVIAGRFDRAPGDRRMAGRAQTRL